MLNLPKSITLKQIRLTDDWLAELVARVYDAEWPVIAWAVIERPAGRLDVVGLALRRPLGRDLVIAEDVPGFRGYRSGAARLKVRSDQDLHHLAGHARLASPAPMAAPAEQSEALAVAESAPFAGQNLAASEPMAGPPVDLELRLKAWFSAFEAGLSRLAVRPYVRRKLIRAATPVELRDGWCLWTLTAFLQPVGEALVEGHWVDRLMPFDDWVRTVATLDNFRLALYDIRRFSQASYLNLQAAARAAVLHAGPPTTVSESVMTVAEQRLRAWSQDFITGLSQLKLPGYLRSRLRQAATPLTPAGVPGLLCPQVFMLADETNVSTDWTTRLLNFEDWVRRVAAIESFRDVFYQLGRVGARSYDLLLVRARDYLANLAATPPPGETTGAESRRATESTADLIDAAELQLLTLIGAEWDCRQQPILEHWRHTVEASADGRRPEHVLARLVDLRLVATQVVSGYRGNPPQLLSLTNDGAQVLRQRSTFEAVLAYQRYLERQATPEQIYLMLRASDLLTQAGYLVDRLPPEMKSGDDRSYWPDLVARRDPETLLIGLQMKSRSGAESQAARQRWQLHSTLNQNQIHVITPNQVITREVRSAILSIRYGHPITVFVTDLEAMAAALQSGESLWGSAREIG